MKRLRLSFFTCSQHSIDCAVAILQLLLLDSHELFYCGRNKFISSGELYALAYIGFLIDRLLK